MRILIVEDELPAAKRLKNVLGEIDPEIEVLGVIESVASSITWFRENPSPDVVLMDVQLSDGLSFEIFESIELTCPIIFTTAFDEYAIRAFRVNSIDYLLKPIETEALKVSLEKLEKMREHLGQVGAHEEIRKLFTDLQNNTISYKSRFLVRSGQAFTKVNTSECAYFYSANKLTHLITHNGKKYFLDYTLEELEEQLNPGAFFRVNRQFILNIDAIVNIHSFFSGKLKVQINPKPDDDIIVSRLKAKEFKDWLEA
ncbi:MAG: LytTR family DNA-binding domain-containing protein [Ignavibacteria bacterium]|nr:LytTR family DNA-binding domain-containing protein [Ignavibacteria bacterium]